MNIYTIIILTTIVFSFVLDLISNIFNLKALNPKLPEEFSDVFDAEKYLKSQNYTRVQTKFGFITSIFGLLLTLVFWFSGGFNFLDQIVRSWNFHFIWTGLLYIGILIVVKTFISLPFSIYSTFVIEERFGFNITTVKTFILDMVKGLVLGIILGGPLLAGLLAFFQ